MDRRQGIVVRGNFIYLDFYYLGRRCRESLKLAPTKPNMKFAENKIAAIHHEMAIGTFNYLNHFPNSKNAHLGNTRSNLTIAQALDSYLQASRRTCEISTWRNYMSAIEFHLKPAFGHLCIGDLTTSHVKEWIGSLSISNKRINNILIPLRTIFSDAFVDGLIERNPITRINNLAVKVDEPDPFKPAEIDAILKELPPQGKNLIQFAIWTGLRTSELIALEWQDVDTNSGCVRIRRASVNKQTKQPKTKAGERDVKLFPPALEALKSQQQFTLLADKRVFHNPRNNQPWETDGQIRKTLWQPALKKAGVAYRNPYQTRHTYASTLLSAGENPMWVAQQMGHKDWGMIRKRYGRWIPEVDPTAGSKIMARWSQNGHKVNLND